MCDFFSFVITKDGHFLTGDGHSHSGIEVGWNLIPNTYREAEWTGENPKKLSVRGVDRTDSNWYKSSVLSKFSARSEFLATITEGRSYGSKYKFRNGLLHCENGPAVESASKGKEWWLNDKRHRDDGPAIEWADGTKHWYYNGKRHREDGPAVEWSNGSKEWWLNGKLHREDGPSVELANGVREWHINNKLHRKDGPAIEIANGGKSWWFNGKRHRIDGPAVEEFDGNKEWWFNDRQYTEQDWLKKIGEKK